MSQLQKKIERIQRRESRALGFGQAQREQPRAMLLGAKAANATDLSAARGAGADVVIISRDHAKTLQAGAKDSGDGSAAGALLAKLEESTAATLKDAGYDFVVSSLEETAAAAVDSDRLGQVVLVSAALDDATLRALGPLGVDALFVERAPGAMTLRQQLDLVRIASLASTPLMVTVEPDADVSELRVLRDSGVAVVVAPEGTGAEALQALNERLRQVPSPRRGRNGAREVALVPSIRGAEEDEEEIGPEPD